MSTRNTAWNLSVRKGSYLHSEMKIRAWKQNTKQAEHHMLPANVPKRSQEQFCCFDQIHDLNTRLIQFSPRSQSSVRESPQHARQPQGKSFRLQRISLHQGGKTKQYRSQGSYVKSNMGTVISPSLDPMDSHTLSTGNCKTSLTETSWGQNVA